MNVVENTNATERKYLGMVTQASYNFGDSVSMGGNYTWSHSHGNLEGETVNQGPSGASIGSYPEYRQTSWNAPQGDLLIDQRHRARFWGTFTLPSPSSASGVTLGIVQQVSSGVPYAAIGLINPSTFVDNPGYVTPLASTEYFFSGRDPFHTATNYRTDLSVNYSYRLLHAGGPQPELFFHGELLNVFRDFQLCGCGASVFNNGGSSDQTTINQGVRIIVPFNPFTTTPVRGVNWDLQPNFGTAVNAFSFTSPRIFRFSVGVRF